MKSGSLTNSVGSLSLLAKTSPITQSLNPFKGVFARTGACGKSSLKREPVLSTVEGGPVGFRRCFRPKVEAPLKLSENLQSLTYVCCLMLWVTTLSAQKGSLIGTVLDENGTAIPFATVLVYEGEMFVNGARADEKGQYVIDSLEAKSYAIVVKSHYAETRIENIQVEPRKTILLDLKLDLSGVFYQDEVEIKMQSVYDMMVAQGFFSDQFGSLTGTIVDEDSIPLGYVTVLVYDGDQFITGTRADEEGKFRVDSIFTGRYRVEVKYLTQVKEFVGVNISPNKMTVLEVKIKNLPGHPMDTPLYIHPPYVEEPIPSGAIYDGGDFRWNPYYRHW